MAGRDEYKRAWIKNRTRWWTARRQIIVCADCGLAWGAAAANNARLRFWRIDDVSVAQGFITHYMYVWTVEKIEEAIRNSICLCSGCHKARMAIRKKERIEQGIELGPYAKKMRRWGVEGY